MYETVSFEEFKASMQKAIEIQGCDLVKIESVTYPEGIPCTLQSLNTYNHRLDGMALFRTVRYPGGDVHQVIRQHSDLL